MLCCLAVFGMFDVTNRGAVTEQQARNALKTVLGSRAPTAAAAADAPPDTVPLGRDDFVQLMDSALVAATPLCRGSADDASS